jgi:L-lysine 4-chlorinase
MAPISSTGNSADAVADSIGRHLDSWADQDAIAGMHNRFRREGFIKLRGVVPDAVRDVVRGEVLELLDGNSERRDLHLQTTGGTPRRMSVVRSEIIAETTGAITTLYRSAPLRSFLGEIAGEDLHSCPAADEEFLITRQERKGDTHGWHWGDFTFALIWILETPPIDIGGMLQCVPHTRWNKKNPRIHQFLCENPIATYGFVSGDLYFLRTDTTLHRTVPLTEDATRIILNMTWAAAKDLASAPTGDDRWWEDADASAGTAG